MVLTYQEIAQYFQERGEKITPDEVRAIVVSAFRTIGSRFLNSDDELLEYAEDEIKLQLNVNLAFKIISKFRLDDTAQKLYKIRRTDTGEFKRKNRADSNWHTEGDTYAARGIAESALAGIIKCQPQFKGKLEIVEFIMFEIK